jgi:hypothetical protein
MSKVSNDEEDQWEILEPVPPLPKREKDNSLKMPQSGETDELDDGRTSVVGIYYPADHSGGIADETSIRRHFSQSSKTFVTVDEYQWIKFR